MTSSKFTDNKVASRKSRTPNIQKTKKGKVKSGSDIKKSDKDSMNEPRIGTFEEAPEFIKNNHFIRRGYRINHKTYKDALMSLFTIHNESVNIWSHFIGALLFTFCIFYLMISMQPPSLQSNKEAIEKWALNSIEFG